MLLSAFIRKNNNFNKTFLVSRGKISLGPISFFFSSSPVLNYCSRQSYIMRPETAITDKDRNVPEVC